MFSNFTPSEKSAVFAFLMTAMCCDGHADPREQSIVNEAVMAMQITSYEQEHATDKTINQQAAVLKAMSIDKKRMFGKYMKRIIEADGYIERHEGFLFAKLMTDIGIDPDTL